MAAYKYGKSNLSAGLGRLRMDVGDPSGLTARANSTAYSVGDYRKDAASSNGWVYKCIKAGTSGGSAPTFPTNVDETVADGGAIWQAYSKGVKAVLCTTTYSPNQDTHQFASDLTNEATGTNYARKLVSTTGQGGKTTLAYDTSTNKTKLAFDNIVWSTLTSTFRYIVFIVDLGTDALSPLISYDDMGTQSPAGVDFTYTVNAAGVIETTTS